MRYILAVAAAAVLCTHVLQAAELQEPEVLRGRVVGITDGDTLTLLTAELEQVKIRLADTVE